jgi:hypothetical protein
MEEYRIHLRVRQRSVETRGRTEYLHIFSMGVIMPEADFFKWLITQLPSNMTGAAALAALFLFAVKAKWIPLSVSWNNKKIITPEEKHYVTKEYLAENCEKRQTKLDKNMEERFKEIFTLLQVIDRKVDSNIMDTMKQVSQLEGTVRVLQERTSHHRKTD